MLIADRRARFVGRVVQRPIHNGVHAHLLSQGGVAPNQHRSAHTRTTVSRAIV